MAANLQEVQSWIRQAKADGMKYIISVCDTFDYDDYPVCCKDEAELAAEKPKYDNVNMQKINEIIDVNAAFAKL